MHAGEYRDLMLHMEWADARIWTAVMGVPSLRQDGPTRERLHHLHCTHQAYLQIMQGLPLEIPELGSFADLVSVGRWARQSYRELRAYCDMLDDARLRQPVEFPWAAQAAERLGSAGPATVGESILQLALHTAHHRGQVVASVRESGGDPPLVDYIAWVWMRRPAPRWESLDAA
jgi:uncharacterized damage-inducible protein DinB